VARSSGVAAKGYKEQAPASRRLAAHP